MRKWKASLLIILAFTIMFWGIDTYKNGSAYKLQRIIQKEINAIVQDNKEISLETIGGVQWDYICFASYEAKGIDVADGIDVVQYGLNKHTLDFPDYAVANENYNELSPDWLYGLVFVSNSEQMLVAISLDKVFSASSTEDTCSKASSAQLINEGKTATGLNKLKFLVRM